MSIICTPIQTTVGNAGLMTTPLEKLLLSQLALARIYELITNPETPELIQETIEDTRAKIGLYPWAYCPGCRRVRRTKRYEGVYWIHNRPRKDGVDSPPVLCGFSGQVPWHSYWTPHSKYSSPSWYQKVARV